QNFSVSQLTTGAGGTTFNFNPGFNDNQAVTYHSPDSTREFSSDTVDVAISGGNLQSPPGPINISTGVLFTDNGSAPPIRRSDNVAWDTNVYRPGQLITVAGTSLNNGLFTIVGVAGATLTLSSDSSLRTEAVPAGKTVTITGVGPVPQ